MPVISLRFARNATNVSIAIPLLPRPRQRELYEIHWLTCAAQHEGAGDVMHFLLHDGSIDPALDSGQPGLRFGAIQLASPTQFDTSDLLNPWAFGTLASPDDGTTNQTPVTNQLLFPEPFVTPNEQWLVFYTPSAQNIEQRYSLSYSVRRVSLREWTTARHTPAVTSRVTPVL